MAHSMKSARLVLMTAIFLFGAACVTVAAQEGNSAKVETPPDGGVAGACGGNESCFVAHPTPGCATFPCCEAVCAQDPFCCEQQWDNFCVGTANQICTGCGGAGVGTCFNVHSIPGCNDVECCNIVCAQDPFCCQQQWDNLCVGSANNYCKCGGLLTGDCFTSHPSPWCNNATCCGIVCGFDPFCCDSAWDSNCAALAAAACNCGGSFTETCFAAHQTPWCRRGDCCAEVCAADPFCCTTQWDNICAGGAYLACCPADVAPYPLGNGAVNIDDLLFIITQWGPCSPSFECPADIFPTGGNDVVGIDDLLFIINRWGPCQ